MISRSLRVMYYKALDIPMRLNGLAYKRFRQGSNRPKVQLGCGQVHYIDGWLNLDANIFSAHPDLWANIMHGLPFKDGSVSAFYSFHVIEHLPDDYLPIFIGEMYRSLVPGGWIRIGGPDAENAARMLLAGRSEWFPDFPDNRKSVGGRFANLLLCRGEHLTLLTESYLGGMLADAGFVEIKRRVPGRESDFSCAEVLKHEDEDDFECPHSLILEARKPT